MKQVNLPLNVLYPAGEPLKFYKKAKCKGKTQGHQMTKILLKPDRSCTITETSVTWDASDMDGWIIPVNGREVEYWGKYSFKVNACSISLSEIPVPEPEDEPEKEEAKKEDDA